ncbi:MAG: aminotransferase class I/II-fold pyridoxal phosphate-dependent enzyme [Ruminococcaceae bacterium]|nr:aminotransferase class I/II-fold pyridoxal phosphate-dependent enzyme [Oscillospiraceae bacterium]
MKYETELLREADPELLQCIEGEMNRQRNSLEMIASESMQPREVLALSGGVFNNKTALGHSGKQRFCGSQFVDQLETLANRRACEIFGADYANMSTYSGTVSNFCVYSAVMSPGDTVLAMDPSTGSHSSHGDKRNFSSKMYRFHFFGLEKETLKIDYQAAEEMAKRLQPKAIVIGSAAYPRRINFERMAEIAHKNNAVLIADIAHFTGLAAAGVSPNPFPHADIVTASTTKTMCGPHSGFVMCKRNFAEAMERYIYPGYVSSLHVQTIAAMAYTLKRAQTEEFHTLMRSVVENASKLSEELIKRGFEVFTGGTDCHMLLAGLHPFGIGGRAFADLLEELGITVNDKSIPFDPSPVSMGIRMGTTVLTQRGMGEKEMSQIAEIIFRAAKAKENNEEQKLLREKVKRLTEQFPIPEEYLL